MIHFGDDEVKLRDYARYSANSDKTTHPCGEKIKNAFGLYDMHGLAWEWCADGKRGYKNQDETDPVGPTTTAGTSRLNRGGSYLSKPRNCCAAYRDADPSSLRSSLIGFRVLVER
jgi:formylglycine-generating enzyme required for sulfatase activity